MANQLLRWFDTSHLHPDLQPVSERFRVLAYELAAVLPIGAETTTALRKLLESKDAAVRAAIEGRDDA